MPRGGKREGAGGKPSWKNGATKTIRVPIALAEQILVIARELDERGSIGSTAPEVLDLSGVNVSRVQGKKFVFVSDLMALGYEIHPLKLAEAVRAELNLSFKS